MCGLYCTLTSIQSKPITAFTTVEIGVKDLGGSIGMNVIKCS